MLMNVKAIIEKYLKENDYDGLYNSPADCACDGGDLFICGMVGMECKPGIRVACNCGEGCKYHIVRKSTKIKDYKEKKR